MTTKSVRTRKINPLTLQLSFHEGVSPSPQVQGGKHSPQTRDWSSTVCSGAKRRTPEVSIRVSRLAGIYGQRKRRCGRATVSGNQRKEADTLGPKGTG
jgi:hypothetical protein